MKILIVGGVAGGATTATRLRRLDEKSEIIIFDRGDYVSFANCGLPYYVGNVIKTKDKLLLQTPKSFKERFNIDVRLNEEVIKVLRQDKKIQIRKKDGNIYEEDYDKLKERMIVQGNVEILDWYLKLRKYGGCIHSGFGLGFDRLLMYLTGLSNIRDVEPYPRTPGSLKY